MDIFPNSIHENHNSRIDLTWSPFLIGVCGGTASGKSTVCNKIMKQLGQGSIERSKRRVVCVSQDHFYKPLDEEQKIQASKGNYDFDHPDAIDNELMAKVLRDVSESKVVQLHIWDFKTHSRVQNEILTVYPADVILFEGILIFYFPEIRDMFHMKLFVDTDPDTRLCRRVTRDVGEHGRDLETVLNHYTYFVKPAFEEFCQPTKKYADVIIPRGADNEVAIGLIVQTIREYLNKDHFIVGSPVHSALTRSRYFSDSIISTSPTPDNIFGTSPNLQSPTESLH